MSRTLNLFFTSDIHGSEKCFRKFLSAGAFYKCEIVIHGGDITGKGIVPIVERNGNYFAKFLGKNHSPHTKEELAKLERDIADSGLYSYRTTQAELDQMDPQKVDELFSRLMKERLSRWVEMADGHFEGKGIQCFMNAGNDDRHDIDSILQGSRHIIYPEGSIVEIGNHEMISTGYTNMTPWRCPRDISEDELAQKIDAMISQVKEERNCIFNFHCPPFDSGLDSAPLLDKDLRPIMELAEGKPRMVPVGSRTVRKAIEKAQPLLGLHGHIHESRGVTSLGETLCINPGSEYQEGFLRGVVVKLDYRKVKSYLLVSG